jgi:hypothetical protein
MKRSYCQREFKPSRHTARYCSRDCRYISVRNRSAAKKALVQQAGISDPADLPIQNPSLDSRRVRELAEWYAGQADKRSNVPPSPAIYGQTPRRVYGVHHSPNALAAGALDAELRAILQREAPELVEIEFERIMRLVRRE